MCILQLFVSFILIGTYMSIYSILCSMWTMDNRISMSFQLQPGWSICGITLILHFNEYQRRPGSDWTSLFKNCILLNHEYNLWLTHMSRVDLKRIESISQMSAKMHRKKSKRVNQTLSKWKSIHRLYHKIFYNDIKLFSSGFYNNQRYRLSDNNASLAILSV